MGCVDNDIDCILHRWHLIVRWTRHLYMSHCWKMSMSGIFLCRSCCTLISRLPKQNNIATTSSLTLLLNYRCIRWVQFVMSSMASTSDSSYLYTCRPWGLRSSWQAARWTAVYISTFVSTGSLTTNTCFYNLIGLHTFLQQTQNLLSLTRPYPPPPCNWTRVRWRGKDWHTSTLYTLVSLSSPCSWAEGWRSIWRGRGWQRTGGWPVAVSHGRWEGPSG